MNAVIRPPLRPCQCKYQKQVDAGYYLWTWIGGRKSWRGLGGGTLATVEHHIKRLSFVLVKCNGCGAELLREHGPKSLRAQMTEPLPKPDQPGRYRVKWSNGDVQEVEVLARGNDGALMFRNPAYPARVYPVGDGWLGQWWPFDNRYDQDG